MLDGAGPGRGCAGTGPRLHSLARFPCFACVALVAPPQRALQQQLVGNVACKTVPRPQFSVYTSASVCTSASVYTSISFYTSASVCTSASVYTSISVYTSENSEISLSL